MQRSTTFGAKLSLVILLTFVAVVGVSLSAQSADELTFTAVEKEGSKMWEGGGTIDLTGPVTLKVKNTLTAEHGFAIDTMKVKEIIKPGEEKAITVPLANIDKSVSEHRVYCQLHPKHVAATIKVAGK
jgi:hypothetical protein